jgi:Uma2 family endonuclease
MKAEPEAPLRRHGMTEDEFYAYADEDCPWQFLGGELVSEPVSERHEDLFAFLISLLRFYLSERGGGEVRGSRYAMRLDPKWSPEPDLLVVRPERRHLMGPQRLEGPADLVIEIASPGKIDLRKKLPRYLEARVPEIWIVDPYARSVRVDTLEPAGYETRTLTAGILASAVVPGFWIDVAWLWQEPLPAPPSCLRQILAGP